MALSTARLGSSTTYSTGTDLDSASVTPTAGRLLELAVVISGGASATGTRTTSNISTTCGGTWVWDLKQSAPAAAARSATYVATAIVPSGAGTGTFRFVAGGSVAHARVSLTEFDGVDTSTPIAGAQTLAHTTAGSGSITVGSTPTTSDMLRGVFGSRNDVDGMTPGTSFTEQSDEFELSTPSASMLLEYRTGTTSTTVDVSGSATTSLTGVGYVIKAGAGGQSGDASLAVTADRTASAGLGKAGDSSRTTTVTLSASGSLAQTADSSLSATAGLTASAGRGQSIDSTSVGATATLSGAAVRGTGAEASLANTASLSAGAQYAGNLAAALAATAGITASATTAGSTGANADLALTSTLSASALYGAKAGASLAGSAGVSAEGTLGTSTGASLSGTATLTADAAVSNANAWVLNVLSGVVAGATDSLTADSVTPTSGGLLLVSGSVTGGMGSTGPVSIGSTLLGLGAWTILQSPTTATGQTSVFIAYSRVGSSPGTGSVTVTLGGTPAEARFVVEEVPYGFDPTDPVFGGATATGTTEGSPGVSLTAPPTAADMSYAAFGARNSSKLPAAKVGWTASTRSNGAAFPSVALLTEYRINSTSDSAGATQLGNTHNAGAALNIRKEPGPVADASLAGVVSVGASATYATSGAAGPLGVAVGLSASATRATGAGGNLSASASITASMTLSGADVDVSVTASVAAGMRLDGYAQTPNLGITVGIDASALVFRRFPPAPERTWSIPPERRTFQVGKTLSGFPRERRTMDIEREVREVDVE